MGEKLKENWYVIVFSAFVGTVISLTLTSAVVKWGKIDDAVPLIRYEQDKKEMQNSINIKADIDYVDDADRRLIQYVDTKFKEHRANDERVYRNLKEVIELNMNEMKAIVEGQAKYMQSVDRRLERIENKDN